MLKSQYKNLFKVSVPSLRKSILIYDGFDHTMLLSMTIWPVCASLVDCVSFVCLPEIGSLSKMFSEKWEMTAICRPSPD